MEALRLQRKYPEVSRDEMFDLINRFNAISTDSPGRVDKTAVLRGKVELEDWVELNVKLRTQSSAISTKKGKVTVQGSNANVSHTINEDERMEFTNHINTLHPELYRFCEEGETIEDLLKLTPDQILLRWFNFHLKAAGWNRRVNNFSRDVKDSENYTVLLNQLKPAVSRVLQTPDLHKRAEQASLHITTLSLSLNPSQVLGSAEGIGCRKYLTPSSVVSGNPRLNLAFGANLFNAPRWRTRSACLHFMAQLPQRRAGVFNLFEDLKDGLIIIQAFDKVNSGAVIWRIVSKPRKVLVQMGAYISGGSDDDDEDIGMAPSQMKLSRFKAVENTNYAVDLAKQNDMHMVGIQGADIVDGSKAWCWASYGSS
ncbi:hypothetical protein BDZ89DRAFT_1168632 [Hymenopellis radicata]|nr:hypothetical protein BDZ89DRAFT_1168632 [Hymenopellis radicata]